MVSLFLLQVLLLTSRACGSNSMSSLMSLFSDVTAALDARFGLKDNEGQQMSCLHVYEAASAVVRSKYGKYFAVYHSYVGSNFQVRLSSSSDLMSWNFVRTLADNADMPQISRVQGADWILMVHEQWMNAKSSAPCQLGFKIYYTEEDFFDGESFNSFLAPLSVGTGSQLEGTPSVYEVRLILRNNLYMLDAEIGFHFNNGAGVDQVAHGSIASFGPTSATPTWTSEESTAYNMLFKEAGAIGNIGQRQSGTILGQHISAQEANVGPQPPTIWEDWRVWFYHFGDSEGAVPSASSGAHVEQIPVKTPKGSTAFGNPGFQVLSCPDASQDAQQCLFVSYFLFGEGAASGEAGVCVFYKKLSAPSVGNLSVSVVAV